MRKIYLLLFVFVLAKINGSGQVLDSLDIMIGQMIMIGVSGTEVNERNATINAVHKGIAGSVILFEKNISSYDSYVKLKKLTTDLQNAASFPLLIAIDQEGGRVNRMKEKYGFPRSVTHRYLGKTGHTDSTRFYSELMASTLSGVGINLNFAPVVDLAINRLNPIIARYERSFSADPDTVVMHASAFIEAHRYYGVLSCLKHFPGHGSSSSDTHLGIADVTRTWKKSELYPYGILIKRDMVDAIMTSHIVNKKLDKRGLPGTLSEEMITGILRDSLGFKGVVFSDDMHMKAISSHYGLKESLKLAINAGVDIVAFSHNLPDQRESNAEKVHKTIRELVETGEISQFRIRESYKRIVKLKQRIAFY